MTLQRMIQRFEDEFPDTRLPAAADPAADANSGLESSVPTLDPTDKNSDADEPAGLNQSPGNGRAEEDETERYAVRLSRTSSNTSLYARALTSEEGRVLRLGRRLSHGILQSESDNGDGNVSQSPPDIGKLRQKLQRLRSTESDTHLQLKADPDSDRPTQISLHGLGAASLEDLVELQRQDPDALSEFKESQIVALINAGLRSPRE